MTAVRTFDPVWEEKYSQGHAQRYPWDAVVSFVYRHYPRGKPRAEVRILEVGCGSGSNLWFTAREGFQVAGIDASSSAIEYARKRFEEEGLQGDFKVGDFTRLPFEDERFDLALDRASITCCGLKAGKRAVEEVWRTLKMGGKFFFNPYSDRHSSFASGFSIDDGLTSGINEGTLVGAGQICFYGRREVKDLFSRGWKILSLQHLEIVEENSPLRSAHSEWRVVAEKVSIQI